MKEASGERRPAAPAPRGGLGGQGRGGLGGERSAPRGLVDRLVAAARRFGAAARLALGLALLGGAAGIALGAVVRPPAAPLLPLTAPAANRALALAWGAALGWWVGLLAGIAVVVIRRRRR